MKLLKFKNMAMIGAMSIAGVGLVGVGAHATFTDAVSSQQQVTAGTLNLELSAPGASGNGTVGNPLVLPNCGPVNSTFDCGPVTVTITNYGNVSPTMFMSYAFAGAGGSSSADTALASETYLCMTSDGNVVENSLLSSLSLLGPTPYTVPAANGGTDSYTVEYYAGPTQDTLCGTHGNLSYGMPSSPTPNPAALSLNNDAEGGVITPTITYTMSG
jgi:predicted ribosomally synthesized peptide with SipW-like signal peptide